MPIDALAGQHALHLLRVRIARGFEACHLLLVGFCAVLHRLYELNRLVGERTYSIRTAMEEGPCVARLVRRTEDLVHSVHGQL